LENSVFFVFLSLAWRPGATTANLLMTDALDPQAKIPEFKACAVQVFPARKVMYQTQRILFKEEDTNLCHSERSEESLSRVIETLRSQSALPQSDMQ
jgi:hypothetical protein